MSWKCECSSVNSNDSQVCHLGGMPSPRMDASQLATAPPGPPPPPKPKTGLAGWQIGMIAGVLAPGVIFGVAVATEAFGKKDAQQTAQTNSSGSVSGGIKSAFQEGFDAGFNKTCRQSIMRSGKVSAAVADSY